MEKAPLGSKPDFRVVGTFQSGGVVEALLADLQSAGFAADGHVIGVHHGEQGKKFIDPSGSQHGILGRIVRATQRLGSWESSMFEQVEEALNAGHYVVSVLTDDSEHQRLTVREIMQQYTDQAIYYRGQYSMEILRRAGESKVVSNKEEQVREPKVLLVGKILPIMDILRDELIKNYGRDVISSSSKEHVEATIKNEEIDLVILGAGFDDETREDIAAMIKTMEPDMSVYLVPRVGEKNPAKLVNIVNDKAIEWKFYQMLGGRPGGPSAPNGPKMMK